MTWQALFGERATTKIVGVFDEQADAVAMVDTLKEGANLKAEQLHLVTPHEKNYGPKMEPEIHGIARTAVRAHLILGVAGLLAGIVLWVLLYAVGWNLIRSTPGLSIIPFLFFPTVAGLLLGGLITSRPDHNIVILHVRDAVERGKWALVVHPRSSQQCDTSEALLKQSVADVWRSV